MKGIEITDEFVKMIVESDPTRKVTESAEAVVEEATDEAEHACPLCESQLEEPLSEETLAEHVDYILDAINESVSYEDGESLLEDDELEDDEYDDEYDD